MKYHRDQYLLFSFHILAYIGFVSLILYGTLNNWLLSIFMFFVYGCLGANITFHRLLAHKSWSSPRWFYFFGTLVGTMSMIGSSIAWVSLHYDHHKYTDKLGDPHSPQHNLINSYLGGMFIQPNIHKAPHLLRDSFQIFLHKNYFIIHLIVLTICLSINPMFAVSFYLAPAALTILIGGSVNLFCHIIGYRNYNTNDNSKNNIILGYLMWGEGWHNNHHENPRSSYLGQKWWEFDISGWIIKKLDTSAKQNKVNIRKDLR